MIPNQFNNTLLEVESLIPSAVNTQNTIMNYLGLLSEM